VLNDARAGLLRAGARKKKIPRSTYADRGKCERSEKLAKFFPSLLYRYALLRGFPWDLAIAAMERVRHGFVCLDLSRGQRTVIACLSRLV
jgi:hypothetical protein